MRLRCPVCGEGRVFRGYLSMNPRCERCGLRFERAPGYFLGSIFFNYGLTATVVTAAYLLPMFVLGRPVEALLFPLVAFCVAFPLYFFRYARCLFLAVDHYFAGLDSDDPPSSAP